MIIIINVFFQYQYKTEPASSTIQTLVRIAMNTVDAQLHHCKRHEDTFGPASPMITRNRGNNLTIEYRYLNICFWDQIFKDARDFDYPGLTALCSSVIFCVFIF